MDLVRILRRIGVSDHQSDIVPDNSNVLETKLVNERMNVLRQFGFGVTIGGMGGFSGSSQIRRGYIVGASKLGNQGGPRVASFGGTIEEDYWGGFTGGSVGARR